jgi:hypothetical protein
MRGRLVMYFDDERDGNLKIQLQDLWYERHPNLPYSDSQALRLVLIEAVGRNAKRKNRRP